MVLLNRFAPRCLALSLSFLTCACTRPFFVPMQEHVLSPKDLDLVYEDVFLESADGTCLHSWFLPARGKQHGTVLFTHGNAENISTHIGSVYWLPSRGFSVLLLDYRGYGKSCGCPGLQGSIEDAQAALKYLAERPEKFGPVFVLGQSLGGAIAIAAVARSDYRTAVRTMIIESAFSSYRGIAREKLKLFWLTQLFAWPLGLIISDAYRPAAEIGKLAPVPLIIIHGTDDPIVDASHAQVLFAAAHFPKQLWLIQGGSHISAFRDELYRTRAVEMLTAAAN